MTSLACSEENISSKAFDAKEDVFAVISPGQKKLGRVKEITCSGITFHYIEEKREHTTESLTPDGYGRVDIFIRQKGYFIRDLPIQNMSESVVTSIPSFSCLPVRQVNVRFAELDIVQKSKLEYLAAHYFLS